MNLKLYLLIISFCYTLNLPSLLAQEYESFVVEGATWSSLRNRIHFPDTNNLDDFILVDETIIYGILGDTVINNQVYSKLYFTYDSTFSIDSDLRYNGALREQNKFVYLINPNHQQEIELYNFNLEIGDIWKEIYNLGEQITVSLYQIDSIQLNDGNFRKQFKFQNISQFEQDDPDTTYLLEWIEGIGSSSTCTVFTPFCLLAQNPSAFETLLCYHQNDTVIYQNPTYSSCYINTVPVSVENIEKENIVLIYPNPFQEQPTIEFSASDRVPANISILNTAGQVVYKISINMYTESFRLPTINFPKGVYFLIYRTNDFTTIRKIIKS